MSYALETPTQSDAAAISACAQDSFRATFAHMNYPPDDLARFLDEAMGEAAYARQIADPAYALRIARGTGGAVIGVVKAGPNDLPMPSGEPKREETFELHQLYLLEEAKGSGLADAMMGLVLDEARARDAKAIYLSVYVENARAKAFYARHGFVEIGKNPFAVGETIDDDRVWRRWV